VTENLKNQVLFDEPFLDPEEKSTRTKGLKRPASQKTAQAKIRPSLIWRRSFLFITFWALVSLVLAVHWHGTKDDRMYDTHSTRHKKRTPHRQEKTVIERPAPPKKARLVRSDSEPAPLKKETTIVQKELSDDSSPLANTDVTDLIYEKSPAERNTASASHAEKTVIGHQATPKKVQDVRLNSESVPLERTPSISQEEISQEYSPLSHLGHKSEKPSVSSPDRKTNQPIGITQDKEEAPGRKIVSKSGRKAPREISAEELRTKARDLARQGQWAEAARLAEKVLEKGPGSLKDTRFLGLSLLSASQYQRGIAELEKLSHRGLTDAIIEHYLGHAYFKVGSYDKALAAFKKAISLDPANPRHYRCGSRLIVDALRHDPRFSAHIPLARDWYEKALALGIPIADLAYVKNSLHPGPR